ncbi:hypothetical protein BIFGAL_03870 [Bifidobacterium gallicum DSM 20093 = LMG 11596]|uniref:Uncharacterized protein n=1 Tax=Bifidobacterium gallicum DSM 20093 = LMG 11596 TaxID=561180 RepID=D1NVI1_9BIFI|nr:hypothetical protein BIFGAL_03870 [Bifidobacterium gallicum DSM 20093 = LMG 11596]
MTPSMAVHGHPQGAYDAAWSCAGHAPVMRGHAWLCVVMWVQQHLAKQKEHQ